MKSVRKKVIDADHVWGSGGQYWDLFLECGHTGYSGGYTKCPKTSICDECTKKANMLNQKKRGKS